MRELPSSRRLRQMAGRPVKLRSDVPRAVLAASLALVLSASLDAQPIHAVKRVVDGDTVVLADVGTVRLIGVDTPETQDPREPVQHFGVEAADFLRRMVLGRQVRIEHDDQRTDKYRRTLGYLYLEDGTFVNREIIRQGYGHAYLTYPFRFAEDFRQAEREARETARGLWATPAAPAVQTLVSTDVWVNSSSRVYHCPGTRYFRNTARGELMREADARQRGFRPAYGRPCHPDQPDTNQAAAAKAQAPQALAAAALATETEVRTEGDVRVWVNASSKIYHCPGTRYFGTTARGTYMTERDAEARGNRPAGGRRCGAAANPSPTSEATSAAALPAVEPSPAQTPEVQVWVNTTSRVYHCPGTRYYGATKSGTQMGQRDAQARGFRPAAGRPCS